LTLDLFSGITRHCTRAFKLFTLLAHISLNWAAFLPARNLEIGRDSAPSNVNSNLLVGERDLTDGERERLKEVKSLYKGIWWEEAYPGAGAGSKDFSCTVLNSLLYISLKS
jgi:hypothetical protein